jgi:hypothetical protein
MESPAEIMAKRKGIVRQAIEASDHGDKALSEKLWNEADTLMAEARKLRAKDGTFTTEPISVNDPLLTTLSKPLINKKNKNNLFTLILILGVIVFSGFSTLLIWSKFQEISRREKISKDVSNGKIPLNDVLKIPSDINLPRFAWDNFYAQSVNESTNCDGARGNSFVDLCNQTIAEIKNKKATLEANIVLEKITAKYGFSRFVDTWGMGTKGLFLPYPAWLELPENEKQILINYAQSQGFRGIIVGEQKSTNNIYLDKAVWGE